MHVLTNKNLLEWDAVRCIQARRETYLASIPVNRLRSLFCLVGFDGKTAAKGKTFLGDDQITLRKWGQRDLSLKRVKDIARYVLDHPDDYVLPPVVLAVEGYTECKDGKLIITKADSGKYPIGIHIIDGQHRLAGLELACLMAGSCKEYKDRLGFTSEHIGAFVRLERGQSYDRQAFADINSTPCKVPLGRNVMFNGRDPVAVVVQRLASMESLAAIIDSENATAKKPKLIAASGVYALLEPMQYLMAYKDETVEFDTVIRDYAALYLREILTMQATLGGIFGALVIQAPLFDTIFHLLYSDLKHGERKWKMPQVKEWLEGVDWTREAWEGVCVFDGALTKSQKVMGNVKARLRADTGAFSH